MEQDDMKMSWTVPVEGDGDDIIFSFPDELLEAMNWQVGDQLMWSPNDDGSWNLTKVKVDE